MCKEENDWVININQFDKETQKKIEENIDKEYFEKFQKLNHEKVGAGVLAVLENDNVQAVLHGTIDNILPMLINLIFKTVEIQPVDERIKNLSCVAQVISIEMLRLSDTNDKTKE